MQRDFFSDRDWFLMILVMLLFAGIGMNAVFVAANMSTGLPTAAWLDGLAAIASLVLLTPLMRYNRWAYLVFVALFGVMAILGIFQAADAGNFLYRFEGYAHVVFGLIFSVGLLGRWRDFMGPGARGPAPPATDTPPEPAGQESTHSQ